MDSLMKNLPKSPVSPYCSIAHSDQIVAAIAKLPLSTFGSRAVKEVALVIAKSLNKANGWAFALKVKTIADKAECVGRTVQRALRTLSDLKFFEVEYRKDPNDRQNNLPSIYRLGSALRLLCEQHVTRGRSGDQARSLKDHIDRSTKEISAPVFYSQKRTKRAGKPTLPLVRRWNDLTQEEQEAQRLAAAESHTRGMARMAALLQQAGVDHLILAHGDMA